MSTRTRQTFTVTFRGAPVRWHHSRQVFSTTSIYPAMYALLTYRPEDFAPSVVATYQTVESCRREIRDREVLRQWEGQSFIVPLHPGTTEVVDAEVVQ